MRLFPLIPAALIVFLSQPVLAQEWTRFVSTEDGFSANYPGHAADALGKDGIFLVRHRARALLPFFEFLLRFAHFSALPVANLQREFFER